MRVATTMSDKHNNPAPEPGSAQHTGHSAGGLSPQLPELGVPTPTPEAYNIATGRRRFSPGRIAFQLFGFLIGLSLLGWCVHLALSSEETRGAFARLFREADVRSLGFLLSLSFLSLVINAMAFWITLSPLRRLRILDVIAVNTLATAASNLPFKLSALLRVLIHHRHDGLALKTIIAWFAAMAALTLGVLGPLGLAAVWRREVDWSWWLTFIGGALAFATCAVIGGRIARASPRLDALTLGAGHMLGHAPAVFGHVGLRLLDIAAQMARFMLAAMILGYTLSPTAALFFAATYFITGVVSPAGSLGMREGAVVAAGMLPMGYGPGVEAMAAVALLVTAGELFTQFVMSIPALLWIRPDRLMRRKTPGEAPPLSDAPPEDGSTAETSASAAR